MEPQENPEHNQEYRPEFIEDDDYDDEVAEQKEYAQGLFAAHAFFGFLVFIPLISLGIFGLGLHAAPFMYILPFLAALKGASYSRKIPWKMMNTVHSIFAALYFTPILTGILGLIFGNPLDPRIAVPAFAVLIPALLFILMRKTGKTDLERILKGENPYEEEIAGEPSAPALPYQIHINPVTGKASSVKSSPPIEDEEDEETEEEVILSRKELRELKEEFKPRWHQDPSILKLMVLSFSIISIALFVIASLTGLIAGTGILFVLPLAYFFCFANLYLYHKALNQPLTYLAGMATGGVDAAILYGLVTVILGSFEDYGAISKFFLIPLAIARWFVGYPERPQPKPLRKRTKALIWVIVILLLILGFVQLTGLEL